MILVQYPSRDLGSGIWDRIRSKSAVGPPYKFKNLIPLFDPGSKPSSEMKKSSMKNHQHVRNDLDMFHVETYGACLDLGVECYSINIEVKGKEFRVLKYGQRK